MKQPKWKFLFPKLWFLRIKVLNLGKYQYQYFSSIIIQMTRQSAWLSQEIVVIIFSRRQIHISFQTKWAAACHNQQAHQHLQQHAICSHQHLWRVTWHPHLRRLFGMHAKSSCTSQLLQKSSSFFFEQCQWDKKPNQHQLWFPIPKGN